jgi:zinc protease
MTRNGLLRPALAGGALAALLLAARPARPDQPAAGPNKVTTVEGITEYRLDNGVRAILFPDSSTSKITVNATVFVGSRHEGYGETGMAHLLEHMVFKGTPTHRDIPRALRDRGAEFNGTTWVDRTNYYETLQGTDDNLEFAIRLEADRLVNSFIKREDLASEMTVVRNEFEAGENSPETVLSQRLLATAYEWHNYGKSTIGNRSDIERVPIERLQAFYRKYYQPDNVMLIVAGKFNPQKALALIGRYFGAIPRPHRTLEDTYTEEPAQDGERSVVLRRVGSVAVAGAVYHIPAGAHEDFAPLEVLATALDMEPSGPLYQALIKTKVATEVNAVAFGWHDPGVLEVGAKVDKDHRPEQALADLLRALDRVRDDGVAAADVNRAKTKLLKARELLMAHSNRIGVTLSEWAAKGDWRLFFLHRDRVARVTAADVQRMARKYLLASNRTTGLFIPTTEVARAAIPATPDVAALMKDYKGGQAVAQGESFDPTVENIQKRVRHATLDGGVKAALLPRKTRGQSVSVLLTLHYGNAESLRGNTSATQFLGPLMARGTRKHTRQELEDALDRLHARLLPGGTLGDLTFQIECKRENLPAVLGLLTEVLREPTFPADEFDVLKRQVRDQLEESRTEPMPLALRALQRKLSPYPPEDVRYIPTVEDSLLRLEAVTLGQVKKLYEDQVGGQHGEFVVVGDFDPEGVLKQMGGALAGWEARVGYRRIERPAPEGVGGDKVVIHTPDKENAFFMAGMVLAVRDTDPQNAALEVADFLFGGGSLSSRLGNRVRQKEGLSYAVMSHFNADPLDPSARFLMYAMCNPAKIDKVDAAILDELGKLRKDGVTPAELEGAKKAYLAQLKQRRASDVQLASLLREGLYAGRTFAYYADLEKKVAALTPEEVGAAFRSAIDPGKLVIIRAGDFKKKSSSQE